MRPGSSKSRSCRNRRRRAEISGDWLLFTEDTKRRATSEVQGWGNTWDESSDPSRAISCRAQSSDPWCGRSPLRPAGDLQTGAAQ
jgi:hypothetical protein